MKSGISTIILIGAMAVLGLLGIALFVFKGDITLHTALPAQSIQPLALPSTPTASSSPSSNNSSTATAQSPSTPQAKTTPNPSAKAKGDDEAPLLLKGVGIDLDYYDSATGKAGDLVFTKEKLQFDVILTEFGFTIPANQSASGQDKRNPQPTWLVPMGTKVRSIVDGVVTNVSTLYSNDYTIMVASDKNSRWQYETEHVSNPIVKVGETVKAGQVIAEVSPHDKQANAGYGLVEIGILKGGNPPQHVCPFAYLDPSIKADIQKKLIAFYAAWEDYRGNPNLHNEAAQPTPGCLTLEAIDG